MEEYSVNEDLERLWDLAYLFEVIDKISPEFKIKLSMQMLNAYELTLYKPKGKSKTYYIHGGLTLHSQLRTIFLVFHNEIKDRTYD